MAKIGEQNKSFSSNKNNVAEILFEFIRMAVKDEEFYSRIGFVVSVDEVEKTAKISLIDGGELDNVRLQQVASDEGVFIKPSINSVVIVSFTDKTTAFISLFSEVDEFIFQDGVNGGLIKINDLVTKLNDLNSKYNDLVVRMLAWVPVPGDGGTALKTAITLPTPIQQNPVFAATDFENDKFKH